MKIVNLTTFRALPPNTVFSKYTPCAFEDLHIKGETWETDFLTQSISDAIASTGTSDFMHQLDNAQQTGASVPMDFDNACRDGCFESDQLFAVWEPQDVAALITRLQECLPKS